MSILADITATHALLTEVLPTADPRLATLHGCLGGYSNTASGHDHASSPPATSFLEQHPDTDGDVHLTGPERIMNDLIEKRADAAREDLVHALTAATTMLTAARKLATILDRYPGERINARHQQAPTGYCRSCYRHDQTLTKVTLRSPSGVPYYAEFCKWCGDRRKLNKGRLPDLKTELIPHLAGRNVTKRRINPKTTATPPLTCALCDQAITTGQATRGVIDGPRAHTTCVNTNPTAWAEARR